MLNKLFQRAHIQYRDKYIHIQTHCVHKRNFLRFLQRGTYHVVVRGGSHFCESPKGGGGGGSEVFLLKRKGGPTLFWGKNAKIPQPFPPPRKNVPSLNGVLAKEFQWVIYVRF